VQPKVNDDIIRAFIWSGLESNAHPAVTLEGLGKVDGGYGIGVGEVGFVWVVISI
jgi:hypothetical protein